MKTIDEREMQKATKQKQTKADRSNGNRSYSERVGAKWFCCAFKLGFLQLIRKASLVFKLNIKYFKTKGIIWVKARFGRVYMFKNMRLVILPNVSNKDALSIYKRLLRSAINEHNKELQHLSKELSICKLFIYAAFYYWLLHPYKIYNII